MGCARLSSDDRRCIPTVRCTNSGIGHSGGGAERTVFRSHGNPDLLDSREDIRHNCWLGSGRIMGTVTLCRSAGLVWETSLSALLMTYAFWRTLLLERSSRVRDWIYAGACWGVAALVNPALAAPFPLLLVYLVCVSKNKLRLALTTAGIFVGVLLAWTLRNVFIFH